MRRPRSRPRLPREPTPDTQTAPPERAFLKTEPFPFESAPFRPGRHRLRLVGGMVTLLLLILAAFLLVRFSGNWAFPLSPDHPADPGATEQLIAELRAGALVAFRAPPGSWKPGETGSFALGIRNRYPGTREFVLSILPESEGANWFVYPARAIVPPGGIELLSIIAEPRGAPGVYFFRILVCEDEDCTLDSSSLYATTSFSLRIEE